MTTPASAEPTAEQVQAAQELHECHRDRYIGDNHYRCVVHETIWPCDVAVTTARALAAAVTAEREKQEAFREAVARAVERRMKETRMTLISGEWAARRIREVSS